MKNTKRTIRTLLILVIFAIFTSAVSVSAASASGINRKTAQITAGKTVQLSVKDKGKITWSSSRKAVATVTTKGKVTGKKAGTATITAKVGKKKYTCKVTVKKAASSKSSSLKNGTLKIDSNTTGMTAEEAKVYKTVVAMMSKYPEGRRWTNGDYYAWNGGIFRGGYGCAGLTFLFSDAAFGEKSQEALIMVTKLSADPTMVDAVAEHGSESFLKHNKDLLLSERGNDLARQIRKLEGLD